MERKEYVIAEGLLRESVRTNNEIGIPLDKGTLTTDMKIFQNVLH